MNLLFLLLSGIPLVASVQSQNELNDVNTGNKCCRDNSITTARKTDSRRFVLEENHHSVHQRIKRCDKDSGGENSPHSGNIFNNDGDNTKQSDPDSTKEGRKRPVIRIKRTTPSNDQSDNQSANKTKKKRHYFKDSKAMKVKGGRGQWLKNFVEKKLLSEADDMNAVKRQAHHGKKPRTNQKDTDSSEKSKGKYDFKEGDKDTRGEWYRKFLEEGKIEIDKRAKGIHVPDDQ